MNNNFESERQELLNAALAMAAKGLVTGTAGNVSMRLPRNGGAKRYLITPASVQYENMKRSSLVLIDDNIEPVDGYGIPSTESLLHLGIYNARDDINAVMHTHSVFATVAAVMGRPIPPVVDELVVHIGGTVEIADYATPASEELAHAAVDALGDRRAVLLRHHGLCVAASTPSEALGLSALVEHVARVYFYAQLAGNASTPPLDAIAAEQQIYRMRNGLDL